MIYVLYTDIDEQVINRTNAINSKFKQLHQSLDERQKILIDKLNKIANDKKEKLLKESNKLKQQQIDAQKVKHLIYKQVLIISNLYI